MSQHGNQPAAPAGWYDDPTTGQKRYWDGFQWGPPAPMAPAAGAPSTSNVLSIIAIVCGAISFLFVPILFGPAGLILGGIGLARKERLAVVALIVSGCGLVVGFILGALVASSMY